MAVLISEFCRDLEEGNNRLFDSTNAWIWHCWVGWFLSLVTSCVLTSTVFMVTFSSWRGWPSIFPFESTPGGSYVAIPSAKGCFWQQACWTWRWDTGKNVWNHQSHGRKYIGPNADVGASLLMTSTCTFRSYGAGVEVFVKWQIQSPFLTGVLFFKVCQRNWCGWWMGTSI